MCRTRTREMLSTQFNANPGLTNRLLLWALILGSLLKSILGGWGVLIRGLHSALGPGFQAHAFELSTRLRSGALPT